MMSFDKFRELALSYLRSVLLVIFILLLWVFCIKAMHAQPLPLVRAQHESFVSYYDLEKHNPALVVYPLEFSHFAGNVKIGNRHFKMDTQLPRPRVKDSDYSNTGYVRGHLCSAGDRDSDKAWLKETYLTSNMVPMTMVCNSGQFKAMEDSCRTLAMHGHRLLIGRAPVYRDIPRVLQHVSHTPVRITIPDAFFCVAMCRDCDLRVIQMCYNHGTKVPDNVLQPRSGHLQDVSQPQQQLEASSMYYTRDERISILLTNIFGSWSREEYETITR